MFREELFIDGEGTLSLKMGMRHIIRNLYRHCH
jgi:hypothetical protein